MVSETYQVGFRCVDLNDHINSTVTVETVPALSLYFHPCLKI